MTGKGLTWTAAHLRAAASTEEVRTAIAEAAGQLGDGNIPASTVLSLLEEIALDAAKMRAEVRAATRVREVLLASVAHDLRNPLNTFAMSAGLLRDDLEGPDFERPRAISLLSRMDRATLRMQGLIEDLLEASRVEAGAIEVTCRPEQGATLVRAVIAKVKALVTEKGVRLEEGAVADDAMVELDKARTVDALAKMVTVALKSTAEGGAIRIGVERDDEDKTVTFIVKAAAPRSSSSSISHDDARTGLAFLIGRGLIASQGGQLTIENTSDGPRLVATFQPRS